MQRYKQVHTSFCLWPSTSPARPVRMPARLTACLLACLSLAVLVLSLAASAQPSQWTRLTATGTPPTGAGDIGGGVFDSITNTMILFGGGNPDENSVWLVQDLDGIHAPTWVNLIPNGASGSPASRHAQGMAYDSINNRLMMFGGCLGGCLPTAGDMWVLSNANGNGGMPVWTRLSPTGTGPISRNGFTMEYDPTSNRLIVFGGQNGGAVVTGTFYTDTWVLTNANGLGGTPAWIKLTPVGGPPAGPYVNGHFYDKVNNQLVVFGGYGDIGQGPASGSNAVWQLSNANGLGGSPAWTNLIPEQSAGSPAAGRVFATSYDPATDRALSLWFSNQDGDIPHTWMLNNANGLNGTPTWTRLPDAPSATLGRYFTSSFDSATDHFTTLLDGAQVWTLSNSEPTAATPRCSPSPGTYTAAQQVTLTSTTSGATIHYTIDGTVPTNSSAIYSGPIPVAMTTAIEAFATASGLSNSKVATCSYVIRVPAPPPVISPASGTYTSLQMVTITDTASATIFYTTDGSTPTTASLRYRVPIPVSAGVTIEAMAIVPGDLPSPVVSATYSVIGSPTVLAAPATALSTNHAALHAVVNTLGLLGSYRFYYGTSRTALNIATNSVALGASTKPVNAGATLTNLKPGTTYFFEAVVTTAGGVSSGDVLSFTTN